MQEEKNVSNGLFPMAGSKREPFRAMPISYHDFPEVLPALSPILWLLSPCIRLPFIIFT